METANIKNLFVPLDGTEWHEQAISYSLLMGEWFEATIDLFFSLADLPPLVKHGEWQQRAEVNSRLEVSPDYWNQNTLSQNGGNYQFGKALAYDYLREITKRLQHLNIELNQDVAAGNPAYILTHKAQTAGDSMIIMYAHPQHRIQRYINRKMAEELLTITTVPLMMDNNDEKVSHFRNLAPETIILPLRSMNSARAALPYVTAIAAKSQAKIQLIQPSMTGKWEEEANREFIDQTEKSLLDQGFDIEKTNSGPDMCDSIVEAHLNSPKPWVILGSRMKRGFTRRIFPSLADNVRREVSCPLLVVPQPEVIKQRNDNIERWLIDWRAGQTELDIQSTPQQIR